MSQESNPKRAEGGDEENSSEVRPAEGQSHGPQYGVGTVGIYLEDFANNPLLNDLRDMPAQIVGNPMTYIDRMISEGFQEQALLDHCSDGHGHISPDKFLRRLTTTFKRIVATISNPHFDIFFHKHKREDFIAIYQRIFTFMATSHGIHKEFEAFAAEDGVVPGVMEKTERVRRTTQPYMSVGAIKQATQPYMSAPQDTGASQPESSSAEEPKPSSRSNVPLKPDTLIPARGRMNTIPGLMLTDLLAPEMRESKTDDEPAPSSRRGRPVSAHISSVNPPPMPEEDMLRLSEERLEQLHRDAKQEFRDALMDEFFERASKNPEKVSKLGFKALFTAAVKNVRLTLRRAQDDEDAYPSYSAYYLDEDWGKERRKELLTIAKDMARDRAYEVKENRLSVIINRFDVPVITRCIAREISTGSVTGNSPLQTLRTMLGVKAGEVPNLGSAILSADEAALDEIVSHMTAIVVHNLGADLPKLKGEHLWLLYFYQEDQPELVGEIYQPVYDRIYRFCEEQRVRQEQSRREIDDMVMAYLQESADAGTSASVANPQEVTQEQVAEVLHIVSEDEIPLVAVNDEPSSGVLQNVSGANIRPEDAANDRVISDGPAPDVTLTGESESLSASIPQPGLRPKDPPKEKVIIAEGIAIISTQQGERMNPPELPSFFEKLSQIDSDSRYDLNHDGKFEQEGWTVTRLENDTHIYQKDGWTVTPAAGMTIIFDAPNGERFYHHPPAAGKRTPVPPASVAALSDIPAASSDIPAAPLAMSAEPRDNFGELSFDSVPDADSPEIMVGVTTLEPLDYDQDVADTPPRTTAPSPDVPSVKPSAPSAHVYHGSWGRDYGRRVVPVTPPITPQTIERIRQSYSEIKVTDITPPEPAAPAEQPMAADAGSSGMAESPVGDGSVGDVAGEPQQVPQLDGHYNLMLHSIQSTRLVPSKKPETEEKSWAREKWEKLPPWARKTIVGVLASAALAGGAYVGKRIYDSHQHDLMANVTPSTPKTPDTQATAPQPTASVAVNSSASATPSSIPTVAPTSVPTAPTVAQPPVSATPHEIPADWNQPKTASVAPSLTPALSSADLAKIPSEHLRTMIASGKIEIEGNGRGFGQQLAAEFYKIATPAQRQKLMDIQHKFDVGAYATYVERFPTNADVQSAELDAGNAYHNLAKTITRKGFMGAPSNWDRGILSRPTGSTWTPAEARDYFKQNEAMMHKLHYDYRSGNNIHMGAWKGDQFDLRDETGKFLPYFADMAEALDIHLNAVAAPGAAPQTPGSGTILPNIAPQNGPSNGLTPTPQQGTDGGTHGFLQYEAPHNFSIPGILNPAENTHTEFAVQDTHSVDVDLTDLEDHSVDVDLSELVCDNSVDVDLTDLDAPEITVSFEESVDVDMSEFDDHSVDVDLTGLTTPTLEEKIAALKQDRRTALLERGEVWVPSLTDDMSGSVLQAVENGFVKECSTEQQMIQVQNICSKIRLSQMTEYTALENGDMFAQIDRESLAKLNSIVTGPAAPAQMAYNGPDTSDVDFGWGPETEPQNEGTRLVQHVGTSIDKTLEKVRMIA